MPPASAVTAVHRRPPPDGARRPFSAPSPARSHRAPRRRSPARDRAPDLAALSTHPHHRASSAPPSRPPRSQSCVEERDTGISRRASTTGASSTPARRGFTARCCAPRTGPRCSTSAIRTRAGAATTARCHARRTSRRRRRARRRARAATISRAARSPAARATAWALGAFRLATFASFRRTPRRRGSRGARRTLCRTRRRPGVLGVPPGARLRRHRGSARRRQGRGDLRSGQGSR